MNTVIIIWLILGLIGVILTFIDIKQIEGHIRIKHILLIPLLPLVIIITIKIFLERGFITEVPEDYAEQIKKYHYLWLTLGGIFWFIIILNLI